MIASSTNQPISLNLKLRTLASAGVSLRSLVHEVSAAVARTMRGMRESCYGQDHTLDRPPRRRLGHGGRALEALAADPAQAPQAADPAGAQARPAAREAGLPGAPQGPSPSLTTDAGLRARSGPAR